MYCLISQADSVVFEARVDPKAIGQDCLEKVCKFANVRYESDYFGLKYENHKGEESWLNLRNPLDRQINFHGNASRLSLRVKFWVPPHILQQESTRHQFYLNGRLDLVEGRLRAPDWATVARLIAYMAQAECGDYNCQSPATAVYELAGAVKLTSERPPADLLCSIVEEHKQCAGMKRSSAEYWFLKEASEFENFGEETFPVKVTHSSAAIFGVGPHGITIYKGDDKELISFTSITSASSHKRCFKLEYLDEEQNTSVLNVKLDSNHLASGLYRAITEKHAFYSCETVRTAVTSQFIRDLKGTIVSIFNEDTTLGKKFVFDIRRTCREVYDNARRALYQENMLQQEIVRRNLDHNHNGDECRSSQEKLTRFLEAMTCKICMDRQINAIFLPCGHGVACTDCAQKCDRCPLCRSDIEHAQKVFLPIEMLCENNNGHGIVADDNNNNN